MEEGLRREGFEGWWEKVWGGKEIPGVKGPRGRVVEWRVREG